MDGSMVITLIVAAGLAFIPAGIASKKGYSYGGFWIFGFLLWIVALIVALCLTDKSAEKSKNTIDSADALLKYKSLLDSGTITQEEFDKVKKNLLENGTINVPNEKKLDVPEFKFKCTACGALKTGWYDTCPDCGAKNTIVKIG